MQLKESTGFEIEFPSVAMLEMFEREAAANEMTPSEFLFYLFEQHKDARPVHQPLALVPTDSMQPCRPRAG